MPRLFLLALLALGLGACARIGADEARLCRAALPVLGPEDAAIRLLRTEAADGEPRGVRLRFAASGGEHVAECRFAGGSAADPDLRLVRVTVDGVPLGPARLLFLQRFWLRTPDAAEAARGLAEGAPTAVPLPFAFLLQAVLNGFPGAGILALLATAYALVTGVTRRIHLATGDVAVIGAYAGAGALLFAAFAGVDALGPALLILSGVLVAALAGTVLGATVVLPLARAPGRMLLVATLGASIVIEEFLRLAQGSGQRWLPPVLNEPILLVRGGDFTATTTLVQLAAGGLALGGAGGLVLATRLSRFGRRWRAVADDPLAAALCGVDGEGVLRRSLVLSGAAAGLAGATLALAYGNVHYAAGAALGLKALFAAILGGVGSVGGALAGGLLIGFGEALWSAAMPIVFRDVATYTLLSLFLVLHPGGLASLAAPSRQA